MSERGRFRVAAATAFGIALGSACSDSQPGEPADGSYREENEAIADAASADEGETSSGEAAATFTPLFDGVSLAGWHGDPQLWRVENGEVVGTTDGTLAQNSFLIHEGSYANFVLRVQFRLVNNNSGIQCRSEDLGDYVVRGYQADIDALYMGFLYEERGRGILANADSAILTHVDLAGWNEYVITADGPHVTLVLNGYTSVDYTEADPNARTAGIIALQLHVGPAMEVRFRNVEVRELP